MQALCSLPNVRVLKDNLFDHACRTILQVQNNPKCPSSTRRVSPVCEPKSPVHTSPASPGFSDVLPVSTVSPLFVTGVPVAGSGKAVRLPER